MGITYGDHLIDSGYHDITPEQEREIDASAELRQRNSDLSYMAGERDILLAAIKAIVDYDDGTKLVINGECGSIALKSLEALDALRATRT